MRSKTQFGHRTVWIGSSWNFQRIWVAEHFFIVKRCSYKLLQKFQN